jgi:hypothetical protein
MTRVLLLCSLVSLLACADKGTDEASRDSGAGSDSGADTESESIDTSDCTPAAETCNGVDDDCDGAVDEADATDATAFYADVDGDGFGDPAAMVTACAAPQDYVADNFDCDDTSALVHPGREEIPEDGLDNDCDPTSVVATTSFEAFSMSTATNGNWTLGYARNADPDFFQPMTTYFRTSFAGVDGWQYPSVAGLSIYRNNTASLVSYYGSRFPAYTLILNPGTGYAATLRWTAPVATECAVEAFFTGCDNTSTIATAYAGGVPFADGRISGSEELYGTTSVTLAAGETIDLLVDPDGDSAYDATCVEAILLCR